MASSKLVLLATKAANADWCSGCIAACPLMQMATMAADGQTELPHGFSGPRTEWLDARQL